MVSEIAAVFQSEDGLPPSNSFLRIYPKSSSFQQIQSIHPMRDPLVYPLFFPYGDLGFQLGLKQTTQNTNENNPRNITHLQYHAHRLAIREDFSIIHSSEKLFLMWIIDAYVAVEGNRLKYLKENQKTLHAEYYDTLNDYLDLTKLNKPKLSKKQNSDTNLLQPTKYLSKKSVETLLLYKPPSKGSKFSKFAMISNKPSVKIKTKPHQPIFQSKSLMNLNECTDTLSDAIGLKTENIKACGKNVGKRIILPSTFIGSPRHLQKSYRDAMAIVTKYGKPDLFITFTCNQKWREIKENIPEYNDPNMRPDIEARVFKAKLNELLHDISVKHIFGVPVAYIHVIEYQKRGHPHAHIVITLRQEDKIAGAETINKIISAELPNKETHPRLFKLVTNFMLHGPCGKYNSKQLCMKNGECSKKYRKGNKLVIY